MSSHGAHNAPNESKELKAYYAFDANERKIPSYYGYRPLKEFGGGGDPIAFYCNCCCNYVYDMDDGVALPRSYNISAGYGAILCSECVNNNPRFSYQGRPQEMSCLRCAKEMQQWQKLMRLEIRSAMTICYSLKPFQFCNDLYLLVRDYLLEDQFVHKVLFNGRKNTLNQQTLPLPLAKYAAKRVISKTV